MTVTRHSNAWQQTRQVPTIQWCLPRQQLTATCCSDAWHGGESMLCGGLLLDTGHCCMKYVHCKGVGHCHVLPTGSRMTWHACNGMAASAGLQGQRRECVHGKGPNCCWQQAAGLVLYMQTAGSRGKKKTSIRVGPRVAKCVSSVS